ncbi:MAG: ABC transporter permease subunit, partial [Spirochaetales bacterium]|nr:ABC transporter permease subunit [Spirochaetales bacterium]
FIYPGLIPNYINFKTLGLINTRAVLILIILIAPFYVIILRSNFSQFPAELLEAARIDGLDEYSIFFRIVLPLSKAILAAVGLFIAVNYWNMMLPSVFFVTDNEKKMVQDYLYRLLASEALAVDAAQTGNKPLDTVLRLTAITIGITPIILVYPFLQKYFVKGALIGSIKG